VIDDKSRDSSTAKGDRPSSLVERVAKKIVSDHARQLPAGVRSVAAPPALGGYRAAEGTLEPGTVDSSKQPFQDTFRDATLDEQPQRDGTIGPTQGMQGRRSKIVDIDIAGLAARDLLTPQSKRNRTIEEMRLIKRRVLGRHWGLGDARNNTIIVTSALPEEGKTTIAINLAMSIAAEEDLRVLLVDADFIKPQALSRLGVTADKGLIDVIQDSRLDISDVMLRTNVEKLSLIPSGQLHDRCTELLASARMRDLVAELSSRYEDRILIFDSPPLLATTEAVTLASHMGQVLFVVQAGRTRRQLIDSALDLIGDRERVGLVLNRAMPSLGSTEFGSYYGYYYYRQNGAEDRA
jgi:protein-tyrosine kinase